MRIASCAPRGRSGWPTNGGGRRPDGSRPPANIVPPFRDYYRVEDDDGGRFWLFRDGPYVKAANGQPTARWFLHGFCA